MKEPSSWGMKPAPAADNVKCYHIFDFFSLCWVICLPNARGRVGGVLEASVNNLQSTPLTHELVSAQGKNRDLSNGFYFLRDGS